MTHLSKRLLLIAASGLVLTACGSDKGDRHTAENETVKVAAEAPPPKPTGPTYCHGGEYNPNKPFKFVYFNLSTHKDEMKRVRAEMAASLEPLKDLPKEAQAEALKPHLAKSQVLAALGIQPLADQILSVSAVLCNFSIYEEDQCTGLLSRSVTSANLVDGTLVYTAPDGRGQQSRVTMARRDYSDMTIEARGGVSHWSRDADDVESFTFKDPTTETRWTENPDCSGTFSQRRKNSSIDASWTSPKTGPLQITYKHCLKGNCYQGMF